MKIGIYTNTTQKCGNAEDARYLRDYLQGYYADEIAYSDNLTHLYDRDVVIINWHSAVVSFNEVNAQELKNRGIKSIMILQNSGEHIIYKHHDPMLPLIGALVAHEDMGPEVTYIPVGIPIVSDLQEPTEIRIGTAGFPFKWKRFDVVAEAAKKLNVKCCLIAPTYDGINTDSYIEGIRQHIPELAEIRRAWHSIEEVVRLLSQCTVNIFWFQSDNPVEELGQSGSVRMGIAAGRPTIISTHRKFRTLFPYEDELYIARTEEELHVMVKEIITNPEKAKRPKRILQDMGWPTVAKQYKELIESL